MSVDVIEQIRRLVESFDECVDELRLDEVLDRVGGVSEQPSPPRPTALNVEDRAGWRRFGLAAAAAVLVAGLVAVLVWVNAGRSTQPSDTPPPATRNSAPAAFGEFVWPAPPRGYANLDDLVTAFTAEVLAWAPADTDRVGDINDRREPQSFRLVNERFNADVLLVATPSPQGWGFAQIGGRGLDASVEGDTVAVRFPPAPGAVSSSVVARLSDGVIVNGSPAAPGRFVLPGAVRLDQLVSVLVVELDDRDNVIDALGGTFTPNDAETSPTAPEPTSPKGPVATSFSRADVVGTWIVTQREHSVDDTGSKAFVPMASPLPTYRFDNDGTLSGFDGCNSLVAPWTFTDGQFTSSEVTNATAAASTILCEDSNGNILPTVGPRPQRLESIDGTTTMVFTDDDITAHAQRLSDLPTPRSLGGSHWILAVDGPDVTIRFTADGTVEFADDTTRCATGTYTYNTGVLILDVEAAPDQCPHARLDQLVGHPLDVATFSDHYATDTILLVPPSGGTTRLFPEAGADTSETTVTDSVRTTVPAPTTPRQPQLVDSTAAQRLLPDIVVDGGPNEQLARVTDNGYALRLVSSPDGPNQDVSFCIVEQGDGQELGRICGNDDGPGDVGGLVDAVGNDSARGGPRVIVLTAATVTVTADNCEPVTATTAAVALTVCSPPSDAGRTQLTFTDNSDGSQLRVYEPIPASDGAAIPGPPIPRLAIGDSVMLGAADELADAGVVVDATVSRQLRDTIEFVAQFHEHGQLGDTVIIHLGNNAAFTVSELDTLMDELNDVPDVIVLTLHTPKNWAAPNNRLLRDLPARHPNVQVVDWEQLATQCPGDCLYADRTHLTPHGQQYYTQLILDALHN
jgi:hypothetical protein